MIIPRELIIEAKNKLGDKAAYVIAKDLQLEQFDEKNLKSVCQWHHEDTPSFIWNPKDNAFKCFGCGKVYGIIDHYMAFNNLTYLGAIQKLFEQVGIEYKFGQKGVKARDYKYPEYTPDDNRDLVDTYFAKRKISIKTLDYFDVKQLSGTVAWNFYDENDVLTTVKQRPARKVEHGEAKEWYLPKYDNKPILFGMNKIDPTKPLLLTEGQTDTMSVFEAGYSNVVSIPGGTENKGFLEECWDWLEQFDKIILWFDNDAPGIKSRKDVANRLGTWRTLIIDLPPTLTDADGKGIPVKDANEVLYYFGKDKVMTLIESAQEIPVAGVSNLAGVGDFNIALADGLFTHLKTVDDIIYKFLMGSVVVLTGKSGSGKSSFSNQIFVSEALNQGYDIFYYSGELDAKVLRSWIDLNLAGEEYVISSDNQATRTIDTSARKQISDWYNNRVWVYDNNTILATDVLDTGINVTRKYGAKIWILDNLMMLDLEGADDTSSVLQKQKEFMAGLIRIAQTYGILIALVIHPRKISVNQTELITDDVGGSGNLTNMAQYVLSVRRVSEKEKEGISDNRGGYKKGYEPIEHDVSVDVLKNRYSGRLGKAMLNFNYPDYRFYSIESEKYKRYKWNKNTKAYIPKSKPSQEGEFFLE